MAIGLARRSLYDDHSRSGDGGRIIAAIKTAAQKHEGKVGLYGAVLTEGMIRKGDPVALLD
jgi:hypothetical protein